MSLAFLSPDAAGGAPARSPLLDAAEAAGAQVETVHGWALAASFGDAAAESVACAETVGFADLSHLAKLELQGRADALVELLGTIPLGTARREERGWSCPLAPTAALVLAAPADAAAERGRLGRDGVRICDLSGALAALAIAGPAARETIARFCALDTRPASLPIAGFRPVSVARTPGYVLREGPDRFLVLFGAAFGGYMWEVLADAAAALGGRPVGLAALPVPEEQARA